MREKDGTEWDILGHASDNGLTISDILRDRSKYTAAKEAAILGEELFKFFNIRDGTGRHLSPEFGKALLKALISNNSEPLRQFVEKYGEHLGNLKLDDRPSDLLKLAALTEERHYTAEHRKKRRGKRNMHEEGQARKRRDREKTERADAGRKKRGGKRTRTPPKKRRRWGGSPPSVYGLEKLQNGEALTIKEIAGLIPSPSGGTISVDTIRPDILFLRLAGVLVAAREGNETRYQLAPELLGEGETKEDLRAAIQKVLDDAFEKVGEGFENQDTHVNTIKGLVEEYGVMTEEAWMAKAAIALNEPNVSFAVNGERIKASDGARELLQALYDRRFVKSAYSSMVIGTKLAHNFELNIVAFDGNHVAGNIDKFNNEYLPRVVAADQIAVIIATGDTDLEKLSALSMLGNRVFIVTLEAEMYEEALQEWGALSLDENFSYDFSAIPSTNIPKNLKLLKALATAK